MSSKEKRIYLSPPHMGGDEQNFVNSTFKDNWIAPLGPNVDGFEDDIKRYLGGRIFPVVVVSGTSAIHLALILLGVKKGDKVIASSFTFCATVNPIVYQGATPILIDSEKDTWNMDPELLKKAIQKENKKGSKPKAIIIADLYGMPAKIDEITQICRDYDIPLIEDAAEALGSKYKNQSSGTFGEFGILSFNGNKIITTSGGGALICKTEAHATEAFNLATQARDKALHYQHSKTGYNYRMSNVLAGIGRGQMKVLDERVQTRRKNNRLYRKLLQDIDGIHFQNEPDERFYSNYWLTTVIFDDKLKFNIENMIHAFNNENIEVRPLWKPLHLQPVFRDCTIYTNGISAYLFSRGLCLPSGSALQESDLVRITQFLKSQL